MTQTTLTPEFEIYLSEYIKAVQSHSDEDFRTNYPALYGTELQPKYQAQPGKRWVKIVRVDVSSKSVFCFIDPTNGDIYKAASWNTPAKGVRGNIYEDKYPVNSGQFYRY